MINIFEVNETNNMVEHENLDVRTITIGISLLSCIDSDLKKLNENIYNRITSVAKDLAKVAGEIEAEYGIPIVNKRISVTPIALIGGAACKTPEDFATIADTMDRAAEAIGADLTIAWENAEIGAMNAKDAAMIMYDGQGADVINEKAAEYAALQTSAEGAAKRGYVDQIISAADTRKYVIGAFEMLFSKREDRPAKKHGTV